MLKVNVGKCRKLSKDFNSSGFSVNIEGTIVNSPSDADAVVEQIHQLFDLAEQALQDQIDQHQNSGVGREFKLSRENPTTNVVAQSQVEDKATEKQVGYLLSLAKKNGIAKVDLEAQIATSLNLNVPRSIYELSKAEAAFAIDRLLNGGLVSVSA